MVFLNNDTIVDGRMARSAGRAPRRRTDRARRGGDEPRRQRGARSACHIAPTASSSNLRADTRAAASRRSVRHPTATMFCAALRRAVWDTDRPARQPFRGRPLRRRRFVDARQGRGVPRRLRRGRVRPSLRPGVDRPAGRRPGNTARCSTPTGGGGKRSGRRRGGPMRRRTRPTTTRWSRACGQLVHDAIPPGATVLVISKGDDELLRLHRPPRLALSAGRGRRLRRPLPGGQRGMHRGAGAAAGARRRLPADSGDRAVVAAALRRFAEHLTRTTPCVPMTGAGHRRRVVGTVHARRRSRGALRLWTRPCRANRTGAGRRRARVRARVRAARRRGPDRQQG